MVIISKSLKKVYFNFWANQLLLFCVISEFASNFSFKNNPLEQNYTKNWNWNQILAIFYYLNFKSWYLSNQDRIYIFWSLVSLLDVQSFILANLEHKPIIYLHKINLQSACVNYAYKNLWITHTLQNEPLFLARLVHAKLWYSLWYC